MVLALPIVLVGVFALIMARGVVARDTQLDDQATRAIAERLGWQADQVRVDRRQIQGDCLIAEVRDGRVSRWVALRRTADTWQLTRVATDADYFDLDDPHWDWACTVPKG